MKTLETFFTAPLSHAYDQVKEQHPRWHRHLLQHPDVSAFMQCLPGEQLLDQLLPTALSASVFAVPLVCALTIR